VKRALFLDRDGVVNVEKNYLYKKEDFEFIDGIFELCHYYQDLGYHLFIVTNQSGIDRGYYTEEDFHLLTRWMNEEFKKKGINIDHVYFCPHHPDISGECSCRKPKPGMLLEAQKDFAIDLQNSLMVGDKERDIEAALRAGVNETYLFDESDTITHSKASKIINKLEQIWKK